MKSNKIAFALHSNQQSIVHSKSDWEFVENLGFQVEYVQSEEIDSCGIFRWEDNGTGSEQLSSEIKKMDWEKYDEKILCGFSSGCNTILKTLLKYDIKCTSLLLQSPWIPMIDEDLKKLSDKLERYSTNVYIVCGMEDEDCFARSQILYHELKGRDINVKKLWVEKLGHEFPNDYTIIYENLLYMKNGVNNASKQ
ncbi:alpha/beta hydrolase [Vallitalea maricola]|uniref:Uncharacterized protein n=1 Tax=Vallitalea maricola TaxID=3074433 RepID=A0ACB5UH92_9FIRM|nr:hypothetical protein AN2V17_11850 [Vallitalea sp. AN17-2]